MKTLPFKRRLCMKTVCRSLSICSFVVGRQETCFCLSLIGKCISLFITRMFILANFTAVKRSEGIIH